MRPVLKNHHWWSRKGGWFWRKGLNWAPKERVYTRFWRQFSRKEVMVSILFRHRCFSARGVAAIRSICAYPADAIAYCWVPFYVCWQVCSEANFFTNEVWSSYPTATTTPVNKVSRNNRTRSDQNCRQVTTRITSRKQRGLGKDRVPLCVAH